MGNFTVRERARGPSERELLVAKTIYDATGILTIKDATTGKWVKPQTRCGRATWETPFQDAPEYGTPFQREGAGGPAGDFASVTHYIRSVYTFFVGSEKFPQGVTFGGVEVWTQDGFTEQDENDFSCVNFRLDVSPAEFDRLHCMSRGSVWVTDEMREKAEKEAAARRDHRSITQADPVGALTKALAEVMAAKNSGGPPDDLLKKAGLVKDAHGNWTLAAAAAPGAK